MVFPARKHESTTILAFFPRGVSTKSCDFFFVPLPKLSFPDLSGSDAGPALILSKYIVAIVPLIMPSPISINIRCDQYLIRFLETLYGPSPVSFPVKSNFNMFLDVFLQKAPLDYQQQEFGKDTLVVQLPYFENKDVRSYFYLSEKAQAKFVEEIWKFFKIQFRCEIGSCILIGLYRKDAIELFIDKYNLPVDCWDMLEKDYQRYLRIRRKRGLFRSRKNSSEKEPVCPSDNTVGPLVCSDVINP
jgi:hypothetical protein